MAALDKLDQQQAQLQKYKAAGVIDADTFREYSARIDASRQKLGEFDEGLRKTGVSSGQTQAALRQLPAQFTDIFTSLAGGQNPLMVLIQQGGQIKDSFGGIGPTMDVLKDKFRSLFSGGSGAAVLGESLAGIASGAKDTAENAGEASESLSDLAESSNTAAEAAENAKKAYGALPPAVTGASMSILGMVAAVAAVAAVIGTLIYGYSKGSQEADEYNKALILTGNYAGTSADQLASLARQVSATNGTTGEAAASLAKLAGSGVVAGDSFGIIAEAAAAMEDATGKSVDATIAEFVKIAKDPVAAAKELNDQYNFLTASVYAQIVALKEQGDTVGAADLLTKAYADTVQDRSKQVTDNLGLWQKAWKGVKDAAAGALDGLNGLGRTERLGEKLEQAQDQLALMTANGRNAEVEDPFRYKDVTSRISFLQLQIEAEKSKTGYLGEQARIQKEGIAAEQRLKQISDSTLSNAEKRDKLTKAYLRDVEVLKKANPDDPKVQADYVAKTLQNIKDKNKDPKAASAGAVDLTAYNDAQNALKGIQDEYANTQKQLDAAQKAGLISQDVYATQRAVLIKAEKEEVTSAYQAEIDALEAAKGKKSTTAAQSIELDKKIADARSNMIKAQKDADSQLNILASSEEGRAKRQAASLKSYVDALNLQTEALQKSGHRAVLGVGRGDRENALSGELNAQDDRFAQASKELANQRSEASLRGASTADLDKEFGPRTDALAAQNKKATDQIRQNYADVEAAQGDWTKGATSAWENYLDSAKNIAGQTKSLFGNAFGSMEDAVVNFAMTGKASFSDFAKSILADMARIATRQASSALLGSVIGAASTYFGGGAAAGAGSFGSSIGSALVEGRASGGPVDPNTLYEVNEKGPELFSQGGRSYLMTGAEGGSVTPLMTGGASITAASGGGGGGGGNTYNFPVAVSVQTANDGSNGSQQDTTQLGRGIQLAAKNEAEAAIAKGLQPGGPIWRVINGR
ncbi:phage tail protein [Pseudomonas marginalis ICMP 9505]|nr:phage tail protein [Pseudomonas marginalis ICMP 9505]